VQYNKNVKISVEYKPREPRTHQLSGTLSKHKVDRILLCDIIIFIKLVRQYN